jgi:8-oxo-dGTP pyrophosphatase MutT (NUDIX family)
MTEPAVPAATLILVREPGGGAEPELLIVERAQGMSFAGGALVFPGGRIDEADEALAKALGLGEDGSARVAAIRETLEETAVPAGLRSAPRAEHCLKIQAALAAGQDFAGMVEAAGLELDPGALTPFARWVPEFHARRRFDTLFFVARAPASDWQPHPQTSECAGAFWLSAGEVLERQRSGSAQVIFPTRRTLERLTQHASFEAIVADARAHPIEPITPWLEEVGGERFVTIPEGVGYPVTREKLEGLWRG